MVGIAKKLSELLVPVRVNEIEEAALRVIARKGVDGLTMQEIAEEAGLGKGTLYLYFASREDLVRKLAESAFEELLELQRAVVSTDSPAIESFRVLVKTQMEFFDRRRDFFRLFLAVAHPGPDSHGTLREARGREPLYLEYLDLLKTFLARAAENGSLRAPLPERLALFLAEGINGLVLQRLTEPAPPPLTDDVTWLLETVIGGLAPDERRS
jgi:AcrR family transcriptional regulator